MGRVVLFRVTIYFPEAPRAFYLCCFGDIGREPTVALTELYLLLLILGPSVLCE